MSKRETRVEKKLKKMRIFKSQAIKALALALAIGSIGTGVSYAYFSDVAEVKNDLVITTGSMDVDLNGKIYFEYEYDDDEYDDEDDDKANRKFTISNKGTLKQKLQLKIVNYGEKFLKHNENVTLDDVPYEITFKKYNKDNKLIGELQKYTSTLGNLKENGDVIDIKTTEGNLDILSKDEYIIGEFNLVGLKGNSSDTAKIVDDLDEDEDCVIKFDMSVKAIQVNDSFTKK